MGKGSKGKEKEAARQKQSREEKGRKTQQHQQQQYDGAFFDIEHEREHIQNSETTPEGQLLSLIT